jgi:threonine synthase
LVTLGEAATPVIELTIDGWTVETKLEFLLPSGSFKDRGFAVLIDALARLNVREVVEDSSGNAAASIASYAARAGLGCTVYAPAAASPAKLVQAEACGATVVRVEGSRAEVAAAAERAHDPGNGRVYASHNWHPWFLAGVTTWALEYWEQRGFAAPDAIIAPAGSGSIILGAYHAFSLLRGSAAVDRLPRLFAVQPEACAPLAAAVALDLQAVEPVHARPTLAEGASIANPVRGNEVLAAIRESGGGAVAVSEEAIARATLDAARQGVYIEPTSALAIAGARKLRESGAVARSDRAVLVLTGSGLKATPTIAQLLSGAS